MPTPTLRTDLRQAGHIPISGQRVSLDRVTTRPDHEWQGSEAVPGRATGTPSIKGAHKVTGALRAPRMSCMPTTSVRAGKTTSAKSDPRDQMVSVTSSALKRGLRAYSGSTGVPRLTTTMECLPVPSKNSLSTPAGSKPVMGPAARPAVRAAMMK